MRGCGKLLVSHEKIGDVAVAQGELAAARASYADAMVIAERLAARDPNYSEWQRDLGVSFYNLAQVEEAAQDPRAALAGFGRAETVFAALAARWPDHPGFAADLARHGRCWRGCGGRGLRRGAINGFAGLDGFQHADILDFGARHRERVVRQDDQIGELAGFDRAFLRFFEMLKGWP